MGGAPVLDRRGPRLSGRDPLARPALRRPRQGPRLEDGGRRLVLARAGRDRGRRAGLPARPGRDRPHRRAARAPPAARRGAAAAARRPALRRASARRSRRSPAGRKLVLATAIAETSLTIPDVRVVVDAGRARRARFDPGSGMTRLVTERVTRAEAEQRRGRAGRVAPGWCYRLWTRGEEGGARRLPAAGDRQRRPRRPRARAGALGRRLARRHGLPDAAARRRPSPRRGRCSPTSARSTAAGRITAHGRALAGLPLHPRLGHMLRRRRGAGRRRAGRRPRGAGRGARPAAAAPAPTSACASPRSATATPRADPGALAALRAEARRLRALAPGGRAAGLAPAPRCRSPIPTASPSAGRGRRRATCSPAARARSCPRPTRSPPRRSSSPPTSTATRARRRSAWRCRWPRPTCAALHADRLAPRARSASGRAATARSSPASG